jgi:hypothetical protein
MGWLTADVDLVLKSISDAIHVDAGHFTYATPVLNIGGTNQAPSHLDGWIDPLITPGAGNSDAHWEWDAGAGKHKAISGGAAIWAANHCAGHPWAITFNGGVSEDSLLGNVIGTGEKTWADSVFGNTTQYYQKFTAVAGTIGDIRIKCATSCNVKVAIYDDDGAAGDPGTLLAYSTSTACVSGWNTVQLNIQVPLTAGSYWLSFKSDTGNFSYRITTGGVSQYSGSIAYADAFPNPAPDLIDRTNDYAIAGWGLKVV